MSPFEPLADAEDEIDPEVYDKSYISAKMILNDTANGGGNIATVKSRVTDISGQGVGVAKNNLLLDSQDYGIEMEDGTMNRLFANKIAENIYSQLDDKGREMIKFNEIIDHRKNEAAMTKENGFT